MPRRKVSVIGEVDDFGLVRGQGLLGRFDSLDDVVERTEVEGLDDPGAAVHALAPARVIIGVVID